jgi:hypothetical protein
VIQHLPFLPDLAPADFFFPQELGSLNLTQETFKKEWEGTVRTLSAAVFATAFRWCYECCEKYIDIAGSYFEKSYKKTYLCP